jgi:diguanylate cyclase (GGDEF)-like protein/PAS domain S-box-containing protein
MARETRSERASAAFSAPLLIALIALGDLAAPPEVPISVLYAMPILMSAWLEKRRRVVQSASVAIVLTLALASLGTSGNLSSFMVWVSAGVSIFTAIVAANFGIIWINTRHELVRSQETQAQTLAHIAEGVVTVDANECVLWMNPTAEAMTGWPVDEAVGVAVAEVVRRERDAILLPEDGVAAGQGEVLISRAGAYLPVDVATAELPADPEDGRRGYVLVIRDASERRNREGAMLRMAYRDPLTGLANRASLTDRLELELNHARRRGSLLGLLFLDLDGLKAINDRLGHEAGDALLVGFAERLKTVLRKGDTVARLGGDEFNVILPDLESLGGAELVAEKILASLNSPMLFDGEELAAGVSIGIAMFPGDAEEPEELMRRADAAMYRAKSAGGQRWARWFFDPGTKMPGAGEPRPEGQRGEAKLS